MFERYRLQKAKTLHYITLHYSSLLSHALECYQNVSKHCSCGLQGEYVTVGVLEGLYRAGGRQRVGHNGSDLQNRRSTDITALPVSKPETLPC